MGSGSTNVGTDETYLIDDPFCISNNASLVFKLITVKKIIILM